MRRPRTTSRRRFLAQAGSLAGAACWQLGRAGAAEEDRPPVTQPRATAGDAAVEPNWDERWTITVGPRDADIVGSTEKAIQAAVDSAARWGGGTVRILPGEFTLRNAVYLASRVRLVGSGADTVLRKAPSRSTTLREDSDWYDQEITLTDADGFQVGDGVCLQTIDPHNGGPDVLKRTLVARSGNRFKLDAALRENFWLSGKPTCATLFPLLSGENIADATIENLTLDGDKAHNDNLNGNYAGCVFLQDCQRIALRQVTARNYNGDGMSWQICHDVTVEDCHSHDNAGLGLHPGSGSQRPVIRRNRLERNEIGLFFCWGVKYGLAEENIISDTATAGISIGHRDTDNLVRRNRVLRSGQVGILFRPERGESYAGHRNRIEHNEVVDSGGESGVAIDVQGATRDVQIVHNQLRETRGPMQRVGIRLAKEAGPTQLVDNRCEGFSQALVDLRQA